MTSRDIVSVPRDKAGAIDAVDLFCGTGGLTHGLVRGGIRVVAGVDVDSDCRFAYETNNEATFVEKNIRDIRSADLAELFGSSRVRLLAGCAPCQPFSTYSRKQRKGKKRSDPKWDLVLDFGRLVVDSQPELVTMENVSQLPDDPVFKVFLRALVGYHVWWKLVDCAGYGVPQTRKRMVLLASKFGPISLREPDGADRATVRAAIGHLPSIPAGGHDKHDRMHAACSLSPLNTRRIEASVPGGTWRDWDRKLLAGCHRKKTGATYPSVYGRMEWDAPSPTITTQCFGFGNGRFGHPEQDRAISLREAALLQTFPENYQFVPNDAPIRFNTLGRLIGNAVPVKLGEAIAESLVAHVAAMASKTTGVTVRS